MGRKRRIAGFTRRSSQPARCLGCSQRSGSLHQASARHRYVTLAGLGWQVQSDAEHAAILEAVETGRTGAACKLLQAHVLDAGRALAAALRATLYRSATS